MDNKTYKKAIETARIINWSLVSQAKIVGDPDLIKLADSQHTYLTKLLENIPTETPNHTQTLDTKLANAVNIGILTQNEYLRVKSVLKNENICDNNDDLSAIADLNAHLDR